MERSGLGISQRATPDGSTKTVFAFAFGAPQAETSHVALSTSKAQMGPTSPDQDEDGPSKTPSLGSGEAFLPDVISCR